MNDELTFHEAADLFPLDEEHLGELSKDIMQVGQRVPIEMYQGKIIDGRRRYLACKKAGEKPITKDVDVIDPIAYVVSLNLHRRHMTPGQLSMAAARAREMYDRQAKERQDSTRKKGDKPVKANLPERETGQARDQVGKVFGVSGKTVDYATKVLKTAEPEVVKAVEEGRMAVSTAAILASEDAETQRAEALNPRRNRNYLSCSKRTGEDEPNAEEENEKDSEGKLRGVGVIRANEAINCLIRIPKNDALRKRGFQIVTNWIKHN